jgi:hypothetical protein
MRPININNHLLFLLFLLLSTRLSAATETLKSGAFIINMGVLPQTIGNGLKPYGMIYDLAKNYNVPIKWVINPAKIRDGIDFTYNAIDYKGGTFVIPAEYRTAAVNTRITFWQTQGVVGVTTTAAIAVPVYTTIQVMPVWTLDAANGSIAAAYFTNAGIPATSYNSLTPAQLTACNDLFVMPHADPTWAAHGNLLTWNQKSKGAIWVACHAVSALENVVNPTNAAQKMNFLSTPSLVLHTNHADGSPPYSYNYPVDPVMQFMGNIDLAQQNGSEQIYLPLGGGSWRAGVKVGVYDATQANVPSLSPGLAATLVYGYGFDDATRGRVMYEGGHSHNKGTADDVAAQRAFFNFSLLTAIEKAIIPAPTTTVALNDTLYSGTPEAFTFSLPAGANPALFPTLWSSSCGGTFSPNATQQNVLFTPPTVTTTTPCLVSVQVTDSCGRKFSSARSVTILCSINGTTTATNIACNGTATGSIALTPTSGTAPFSYKWTRGVASGSGAGTTISGLVAGIYNVTITSNEGCIKSFSQTLTEGGPLSINGILTHISCKNAATGAINNTISGGTAPYSFIWNDGITTKDRGNLAAGTYNLTVTDGKNCVKTAAFIIIEPTILPPTQPTANLTQPTCAIALGIIEITAPIAMGMTYSIDGVNYSNTTGTFNNVAPSTYNLTVKDINGCVSPSFSATINATVSTPTVSVIQPTCTVATGEITVVTPVGTGFSYSLDGVDFSNTTGNFPNLVITNYSVFAKNSIGCISAATAVSINAPIAAPTVNSTPPSCGQMGTITVTAPTETGMTYSIDGVNYSNTTGIFTNIGGGTHAITAKSAAGCLSPATVVTFVSFTQLDLKVFLEGAYQTTTETMKTTLNQRGLLPGQTPIGEFGAATPLGQPFKNEPWNYRGTEGDTITTYPTTVVDWVLVSLRTDSLTSNTIFRKAGWLHSDGHISFVSPCFTLPDGGYFVLIEHRNHIGVLSRSKTIIQSNVLMHDFTVNDSYVMINPPSFGQKQKGAKWVMLAGDGQKNTPITNYDINFNDSQLWKIQSGIFDQYLYGDYNMDADINFSDSFLWKLNSGKYSGVVHW